jgi:hypothetical protein
MNIEKIVQSTKLPFATVAAVLFPENKEPERALTRVIKGLSELNASQVTKLSEISSVPVSEIYESGEGWTSKVEKSNFIFMRGETTIVVDSNGWMVTKYVKGEEQARKALVTGTYTLPELLSHIENL